MAKNSPSVAVRRKLVLGLVATGGILLVSGLLSLAYGPVAITLHDIVQALLGRASDETQFILVGLRLPRTLVAMLVGAALGGAGALFQALLRNPLAEPFILGVSGGAAAAAVLTISIGLTAVFAPAAAAFAGAVAAMLIIYSFSQRGGAVRTDILLLVGVVANAFFSAVILFALAVTDSGRLMRAYNWLMGHVGSAGYVDILYLLPVVIIGAGLILSRANEIQLLQLGRETAWHLGVDTRRLETFMFVSACLLTGAAVAAAGIIGFVGLIVPHIVRRLVTSDFRVAFPLSMVGGAALLVLSDTLARTLLSPSELPVGVLTAMLGAPFFLFLLRRRMA